MAFADSAECLFGVLLDELICVSSVMLRKLIQLLFRHFNADVLIAVHIFQMVKECFGRHFDVLLGSSEKSDDTRLDILLDEGRDFLLVRHFHARSLTLRELHFDLLEEFIPHAAEELGSVIVEELEDLAVHFPGEGVLGGAEELRPRALACSASCWVRIAPEPSHGALQVREGLVAEAVQVLQVRFNATQTILDLLLLGG